MKRWIVANVSDLTERRSRTVVVDGIEVALFKLSTGEVKAIENRCPHKGGKLSEGIVCDHHVFCPLHDWKIDMNDGLAQEPDEGCVVTYQVEVDVHSGDIILSSGDQKTRVS